MVTFEFIWGDDMLVAPAIGTGMLQKYDETVVTDMVRDAIEDRLSAKDIV